IPLFMLFFGIGELLKLVVLVKAVVVPVTIHTLVFSPRAERLVFPTFSALAQIPTLAWIPLFMLFFGIGELLKLVVLVKAVVVPVTIHTLV
ncbi:hypothetical protein ACLXBB_36840, partial [Pseudomonas aeruginosa]